MANASWPTALPAYVLEQGYTEAVADQFVESAMEVGSPKKRRRYTRANRQFTMSMAMTEFQAETFEAFYDVTLAHGTLPFDWVHPRLQTALTFSFRHPPPKLGEITGDKHVWSFALEALVP